MNKLKGHLLIALAIALSSCNPQEDDTQPQSICMECTTTSQVAIGGGNPSLWPGEQTLCGTEEEIQYFEASYYNQVYLWKQSWTWSGAGNYTADCDRY